MKDQRGQIAARGITLVETVLSMAVASLMLVASLNTVAAARVGQVWNTQRMAAATAASALMAEVRDMPYADPQGDRSIGPDSGELTRALFDDVDDYDGYAAACVDRAGAALPGTARMTFAVEVKWVEPTAPETMRASDSLLKRVTVRVLRDGTELARLTACRSELVPR
ncbi:MAG: hypothetical protein ACKVW3_06605 [Phycisphaerales bacterium]